MKDAFFFTLSEKDRALPFYVTSVGHWDQFPISRPDGFPDFHWMHTIDGQGIVTIGETKSVLPAGKGFFMTPHTPHHYHADGVWRVMWVTVNGVGLHHFFSAWGLRSGFYAVDPYPLSQLIRSMLAKALERERSPMRHAELASIGFALITELIRQTVETPSHQTKREQLRPLVELLQERYAEHFTLKQMAQVVKVTPQHLCRLFRDVYGTTPNSFLTDIRIQKAKEQLITRPEIPIADIARKVGFDSHSYFTSVFVKREQLTPRELRRSLGHAP